MRGASPKAPDPEIPEAVNDLLVKHINSEGALNGPEHKASDARYAHNAAVLEAYRRGQKSGRRCHHDEVPNGAVCTNCGATHVDQYIKRNGVGGAA